MTSTSMMQGLSEGKPSSKVLNPPGGRSSNIFGDVDDTRPASASKKPISNVFETEENTSSTQGSINKARSQESSKFIYGGDIFNHCNVNRYEKSRSSPRGSTRGVGDGPGSPDMLEKEGAHVYGSRPATALLNVGLIGDANDRGRMESRFEEMRLDGVSRAATRGVESRGEAGGDRTTSRATEVQTDATNLRVTSRAMQTLCDDVNATRPSPLGERIASRVDELRSQDGGSRGASRSYDALHELQGSRAGSKAHDLIAEVAANRAQSRINQLMNEGAGNRVVGRGEADLLGDAAAGSKPVSRFDELKAEMAANSRNGSRASEPGDYPLSRMASRSNYLEEEAAASRAARRAADLALEGGGEMRGSGRITPVPNVPEATASEPVCQMRRAAGCPAKRHLRSESTQDRLFGGADEDHKPCGKGKGAYNPITGQNYDGSPSQQSAQQVRARQPPGGFSSGLW